ncbi:MAG: hypothetical protein ACE5MI_01530 [Acidimicrobiia bacterium]
MTNEDIVRIVPDIPSFAVDDGFSYLAPMTVSTGAIVRVPLGGRTVRGYVVGRGDPSAQRLKEIRSVSGHGSVFGRRLLEVLRWASHHYVAPLSVMLGRTAPPNLPREVEVSSRVRLDALPVGPLATTALHARAGRHTRPHYLMSSGPWDDEVASVAEPVLAADRSGLVVVPTAAELGFMAARLADRVGDRLLVVAPDTSARDTTEAWSRAASTSGFLVVGTPRVALWPVRGLSLLIVIEEGRRAMKERQTPTLHVRDVLARRAAVERIALAYMGRVPTSEVIAAGTAIVRSPGRRRAWPLVEIVDRSEDPPGSGLFSERVKAALRTAAAAASRVFLFSHRHGYSAAARCRQCGELRVCQQCGARPDPGTSCRRCGADLGDCAVCGGGAFVALGAGVGRVAEEAKRIVGEAALAPLGRIAVGTERDLAGAHPFDLAVVVDADGLILGTNYRASEEALRTLVRVASAVQKGTGRRAMVQTLMPSHEVIRAVFRGDPLDFLEKEISERGLLGLPPTGELIVLETRHEPTGFDERLRQALEERAAVLGPSQSPRGSRWLIQGTRLAGARSQLRDLVQHARDAGARVRIDADPIDL